MWKGHTHPNGLGLDIAPPLQSLAQYAVSEILEIPKVSLQNGAPDQLFFCFLFFEVKILGGCPVPGCSNTRQPKSNRKRGDGIY